MSPRSTIHACPPSGQTLTPCCNTDPFELPVNGRITSDLAQVTCGGREPADADQSGAPPPRPAAEHADEDNGGGILPPFSGDDTECQKCRYTDVGTLYRQPVPVRYVDTFNGRSRPGPLPERLERQCARCAFQWDEAVIADEPGMTVEALAHAVDNASPYPYELPPEVCTHIARQLLQSLCIRACIGHPLWRNDPGQPHPAAATPEPAPEPNEESAR
ncbi:hypothetical protein [Streptomyces sp. NPDC056291]|uniref:hypothetical protein n=1 Tax=Streptomyces sp. NPDC056291 TaxID=3345772 RepID=UPI0035DCDD8E